MKIIKFRSIFATCSIAGLLTMSACGAHSSSAKSGSANKQTKKDSKPKELVLYSAEGFDQTVADAFQKKTGIKVKLIDDSTGNVLAKVQAERNNPHWDVAWFDGASSMTTLGQQGMLMTGWKPKNLSNYTSLGKKLLPSNDAYFPSGTTAAGAIAYNTKTLKPSQAPKDWKDLLKPEFKNAVSIANPNISGPAYPLMAGFMQQMGMQKGKQFYTNLKKNGVKIANENSVALKNLLSGAVKAAIFQDSAILDAKKKGNPIQIVYPTSGVTMLPSVMGIDKNAPDKQAAKEFVNFVLSKEGQKVMLNTDTGDALLHPIIKGVNPLPARHDKGIKWNSLNATWAAKHENDLKKWFQDNVAK